MLESIKNGSIKNTPEGKMIKEKKEMIQGFIMENAGIISKDEFTEEFAPIVSERNQNSAKMMNRRLLDVKNSIIQNMRHTEGLMMINMKGCDGERVRNINNDLEKRNQLFKKFGYKYGTFLKAEHLLQMPVS